MFKSAILMPKHGLKLKGPGLGLTVTHAKEAGSVIVFVFWALSFIFSGLEFLSYFWVLPI